jgi:pimeloyl-ACP methyl ester carboxylesterase
VDALALPGQNTPDPQRYVQEHRRAGADELGGVVQWLTVRGHDVANPILLYVHGGPGGPTWARCWHFVPELEEHFVVAHWSQRGAGKSYARELSGDRMTMAQFVADLEELSLHLLQRFGQRKLFLVGHSWGTVLGMGLLTRRPDLVAAYVGVNQVVDRGAEELRAYRACLRAPASVGTAGPWPSWRRWASRRTAPSPPWRGRWCSGGGCGPWAW